MRGILAASDDRQTIRLIDYCLTEAVNGLEGGARLERQVRPPLATLMATPPPDAFAKWTEVELAALDAHDHDDDLALDRLPPIKSRAARRVTTIRY